MTNTNLNDIEAFLNTLRSKILIWNIIFENRDINYQTLLELGLTPDQRITYIKNLIAIDYVSGPTEDNQGGTPLWVFGKEIYGREIYIKIQLNISNKPVICISFHFAKYPLLYPLKD